MENQDVPIIVYPKYRGLAQPIRYLFYYMNVNFEEINIGIDGKVVTEGKSLPEGINIENLPILIHQGNHISHIFPIISYLCKRFDHKYLLGATIYQKARVNQMFQKYLKSKSKKITIIMNCFQEIAKKPQEKLIILKKYLKTIFTECAQIIPMIKFQQTSKQFILINFSCLDFLLFESCFYLVNIFSNITTQCPLMKGFIQYKKMFEKQPWYITNKEKLQSFKIIIPGMQMVEMPTPQMFKQIWMGDPKYLPQ